MIIFAPSEEKIKQAVEYVAPLVEPFKNIKPKRRIKKKSSNLTGSKSRFLKEDPDQGNLLRGIVNWSGVARSVAQGQKHSLFYNFSNIFYFISTWNKKQLKFSCSEKATQIFAIFLMVCTFTKQMFVTFSEKPEL